MRAGPTRLRPRDVVLFVLVGALVAAVGCEAKPETQAGAGQQDTSPEAVHSEQQQEAGEEEPSEGLTLTLSAPEICETERGRPHSSSASAPDLRDVAEAQVRWHVEGGTPPYMVEIDGETRDASQEYMRRQEFGLASVSCALRTGTVSYQEDRRGPFRQYTGDFLVDSGRKTIAGTVTDGAGRTAEATADMYVIATVGPRGTVLSAGERYSVTWIGTSLILTIPDEFDLEFWGHSGEEGDGDDFSYSWVAVYLRYMEGDVFWAGIEITLRLAGGGDFDPWSCPGEEGSRHMSESADEAQARRIHAAFDDLLEKIQVLSIDPSTYTPCLTTD